MNATHDVTNQSTPLADVNLWRINRPLQAVLAADHPTFERARFEHLGDEAGGAAMQDHARLADRKSVV